MKKWQILPFVAAATVLSCNTENKHIGTAGPSEVEQKLAAEYEAKNLRYIPYMLNFKDLPTDNDWGLIADAKMARALLFIKEDKSAAAKPGFELDWKSEDKKVQNFLSQIENDRYSFLYRQECAQGMLAKTNLLSDNSDGAKTKIAEYVNILADEGSYSPGIVLYSVEKLNGFPDENFVRTIIASQINNMKKYEEIYDKAIAESKTVKDGPISAEVIAANLIESKRQNLLYIQRLKDI
ncbi:MAG: hypothetical protein BGO21_07365 [Dyadobacter sp. 50-39]|uniref:hypothetical protein n=1 Tax=Dyadobacter sp. 50-39 TaxID=1895756 RepID=UPI0009625123|nr:hypothetical protein [Dyadobacter sp. 50-39]OJV17192.1 MAG: hypothetical protein BGO21_07365 [Dyadobacter sp. 50-39]